MWNTLTQFRTKLIPYCDITQLVITILMGLVHTVLCVHVCMCGVMHTIKAWDLCYPHAPACTLCDWEAPVGLSAELETFPDRPRDWMSHSCLALCTNIARIVRISPKSSFLVLDHRNPIDIEIAWAVRESGESHGAAWLCCALAHCVVVSVS